ncbi:MAG: hypothetical protein JRJ47_14455 [Deltaproteobacteria bacterium]|nr:hypothetical protein [Deltaproteobacteria bacterium]
MHSWKYISVFLVLVAVSPAYGQTITYSLLGHQRQIGPIEQSLYHSHRSFPVGFDADNRPIQSNTSGPKQPSIARPILGGVVGFSAGVLVLLGLMRIDSEVEIPQALRVPATIAVLGAPSIMTAVGTHIGNNKRGLFPLTLVASIIPHALYSMAAFPRASDQTPPGTMLLILPVPCGS